MKPWAEPTVTILHNEGRLEQSLLKTFTHFLANTSVSVSPFFHVRYPPPLNGKRKHVKRA